MKRLKFKKKTAVRLNDIGEVISGTLADALRPQGWQRIINDNYFVSALYRRSVVPSSSLLAWQRLQWLLCQATVMCVIRMTPPLLLVSRARFLSVTIASRATVSLGEGQYGFVPFADSSILEFLR